MTPVAPPGQYECSGLVVASEIPLSAPRAHGSTRVDVTVTLGEPREQPYRRPSSDVVAELVADGFVRYSFCRVEDGYVGRVPHIADFVIDADLRRVVCQPVSDDYSAVLSIIIPGTVTAFLLAAAGHLVLHASAVDVEGRAIAFVGASGQGKSTMAALFCAAGAALVADDLLPLEFGMDGEVRCVRSGREIRLRQKAASLGDRFGDDVPVRVTPDDRHGITPNASTLDRLPLAAVILPKPSREITEPRARLMGAGEASLSLGRHERIEGWSGRDHLRHRFDDVGRVVSSVPVFEVIVPWGPPFAEGLAPRVLESCGLTEFAHRLGGPARST